MTALATIVDTSALLKAVVYSFVAGVGLTLAFSLAIMGAARLADAERSGRRRETSALALLTAASLAVCVGIVVVGMIALVSK
jgi:uncharacterized membrane protein YidH (DUF202 family)